jgi:DNA-binding transcriptional MerR regulator
MSDGLRVGQLAEAAGIGREALRYYERRGLLEAPERTLGGHRVYPPQAVARLRLIKAAQRLGFTLGEIADLTDSKRRRPGTDGGLQDRAHAKLAQIEARIGELETVADLLRQAVTAGCDDLDVCEATPGCPLPFTPEKPNPTGPSHNIEAT